MMHYVPKPQQRKLFQKPVWVLCHWRSGSYYLTNLLNTTNLFHPIFDEWFRGGYDLDLEHWKRPWPPYRKNPNADKEWLLRHLPPYMKTFYVNYESLGFTDEDSHLISKKYLPGIRFILLRRRDQVGSAVSFYIADYTDWWMVNTPEEVRQQASIKVPIDYSKLLDAYDQTLTWWSQWDRFLEGHEYLDVYYEDLVSSTHEMDRILEYLGIRTGVYYECTTMKIQHPQTARIRALLEDAIAKGDVPPPNTSSHNTHPPSG